MSPLHRKLRLFGLALLVCVVAGGAGLAWNTIAPRPMVTCQKRPPELAGPPSSPPPPPAIDHGGAAEYITVQDHTKNAPELCTEDQLPRPWRFYNRYLADPLTTPVTPESLSDKLREQGRKGRLSTRAATMKAQATANTYRRAGMQVNTELPGPRSRKDGHYEGWRGAGVVIRVENPRIDDIGHSLAEIALCASPDCFGRSGADENPASSRGPADDAPGLNDTLEIGWIVSAAMHGGDGPYLFVFHRADGEDPTWNSPCPKTVIGWDLLGRSRFSGESPGCFHVTNASYAPGMSLRDQQRRRVYTGWVHVADPESGEGRWWAWWDNEWLGYVPDSTWSGRFQTSRKVLWYGEVAVELARNPQRPSSEMGNGRPADDPGASSMSWPCVIGPGDWVCRVVSAAADADTPAPEVIDALFYSAEIIATPAGHVRELRYGGPQGP